MPLTPLISSLADLQPRWRSESRGAFDLRDYGAAAGDPTANNLTAINTAITTANATGGGEVAVPPGDWYVKPSTTTWIELRSNVTVRMAAGARLIVRDDTGDYKYLISGPDGPAGYVEHVAWIGGAIDHNPSGNGGNVSLTNMQATFRFDNFTDLTIEGVRLDPYTGVNAFQFYGSPNDAGDLTIDRCRCRFERGDSTTLYDTSTIYASARRVTVLNNFFTTDQTTERPQGAIEVHGPQQVVIGNVVDGFSVGTWLVPESSDAMVTDTFGVVCTGNTYVNVGQGVGLASPSVSKPIRQAVVSGNSIKINSLLHDRQTYSGITLSADSGGGPAEDVLIFGNTIDHAIGETRTLMDDGVTVIQWGATAGILVAAPPSQTAKGVQVYDNVIRHAPAAGIRVLSTGTQSFDDLWIRDNLIVDAGTNTGLDGTSRVGIGVNGSAEFRRCVIEHNRVIDTGASALVGAWAWRIPSMAGTDKDLTFRRNLHTAVTGSLSGLLAADVKIDEGTASLNFPSIAAQTCVELTVTVKGALTTDVVYASPANGIEAGLNWSTYVSAADTVTVRVCNPTGSAIDPAARTWYVGIQRRQG